MKRWRVVMMAVSLVVSLVAVLVVPPPAISQHISPYVVSGGYLSVSGNNFDGETRDTLSSNVTDSVTTFDALDVAGIRGIMIIANTVADSSDTIAATVMQAQVGRGSAVTAFNGAGSAAGSNTGAMPGTWSTATTIPPGGSVVATFIAEASAQGGSHFPSPARRIKFRMKGAMVAKNGGAGATNRNRPTHGLTLYYYTWK